MGGVQGEKGTLGRKVLWLPGGGDGPIGWVGPAAGFLLLFFFLAREFCRGICRIFVAEFRENILVEIFIEYLWITFEEFVWI